MVAWPLSKRPGATTTRVTCTSFIAVEPEREREVRADLIARPSKRRSRGSAHGRAPRRHLVGGLRAVHAQLVVDMAGKEASPRPSSCAPVLAGDVSANGRRRRARFSFRASELGARSSRDRRATRRGCRALGKAWLGRSLARAHHGAHVSHAQVRARLRAHMLAHRGRRRASVTPATRALPTARSSFQ